MVDDIIVDKIVVVAVLSDPETFCSGSDNIIAEIRVRGTFMQEDTVSVAGGKRVISSGDGGRVHSIKSMIIIGKSIVSNSTYFAVEEIDSIKFLLQVDDITSDISASGVNSIDTIVIANQSVVVDDSIVRLVQINTIKAILPEIIAIDDLNIPGVENFNTIIKIGDVAVFDDNIALAIDDYSRAKSTAHQSIAMTIKDDIISSNGYSISSKTRNVSG